ncbi:MAG: hypothetical protein OXB86_00610, partial [Bdellovibrionales bacterium]|nr:hypothetical protein [Bdellovibrionales bacterium]
KGGGGGDTCEQVLEHELSNNRTRRKLMVSNAHLVEMIDSKGKSWHLDNCDRLNALNFNRYQGWECSAGYRSIAINGKGQIKRGFRCKDKPLGYLNKDFSLLSDIKTCITPICPCNADNKVPKRKTGTKHPLFKKLN